MSNDPAAETPGTTRRDVLRRGALIGGAVWAAPLVTAVPARAEDGDGSLADLGLCSPLLHLKWNFPNLSGAATWPRGDVTDSSGGTTSCPITDFQWPTGILPAASTSWLTEADGVTRLVPGVSTGEDPLTNFRTLTQVYDLPTLGKITCYSEYTVGATYTYSYKLTVPQDCRIVRYRWKPSGNQGCTLAQVDPGPETPFVEWKDGGPTGVDTQKPSHVAMLICCAY